jgi:hypothetical protein
MPAPPSYGNGDYVAEPYASPSGYQWVGGHLYAAPHHEAFQATTQENTDRVVGAAMDFFEWWWSGPKADGPWIVLSGTLARLSCHIKSLLTS